MTTRQLDLWEQMLLEQSLANYIAGMGESLGRDQAKRLYAELTRNRITLKPYPRTNPVPTEQQLADALTESERINPLERSS